MKELIGLNDRHGTPIKEGDIVEFTVDYDAEENPTYDTEEGTKMTDTVIIFDDIAYFQDPDTFGLAFAWRHNEHCTVIGNIHDR